LIVVGLLTLSVSASFGTPMVSYSFGTGTTGSLAPDASSDGIDLNLTAAGANISYSSTCYASCDNTKGFTPDDSLWVLPNSQYTPTATSATGAVARADYFTFTVTPQANVALNLSSLTFDVAVGSNTSTRGWALESNVGAGYDTTGANILATAVIPTTAVQGTNLQWSTITGPSHVAGTGSAGVNCDVYGALVTIDVSGDSAFQDITAPVSFQIYSYESSGSASRGVDYGNIAVNGTVVATPEPATMALLVLGGIGALIRRRK
jgi:hypothetical protein